ncbi:PREDICTED: double-stranded RNA-binding protein 8-like [Nicotiana attenuata]|uniref:Double-stranded rna-binding protein 4 n=1 Tax=Nicotiana attenuata TaxID=49451 RepID=A0A1J6I2I6_NICAT|nr:PREDICTED: double-stranded RNA-binding protein 8-like [Nicotiana attenuata]OIS99277.1 double-stranded rna-binding protein 4 [Nicotiana attenuata]
MAEANSVTQSSEQPNKLPEAVANQNSLPNIPENEAEKSGPQKIPDTYKNRLQEFTQRSSLDRPVYHTVNEGSQHAPLFRSSVLVDRFWYTSPSTFSQLKAAEQDAAKVALTGVKEKMKHEGCPLIREDTVFCKSILNEYAVKMKLEKPIYHTVQPEGLLPVFKSTAVFNGNQYMGETGKNKKEAEQMAARAAVMSILETDSGTMMLEIIKSKRKLYVALDKVQDTGDVNAGFMPTELNRPVHVNKRKEVEVIEDAGEKTYSGLLAYSLGQPSDIQALNQLHVFKRPKLASSSVEVAPPMVFVPPVVDPSLLCSTSGKRRNRRNKKNANKDVQVDPQAPGAMLPLTQLPPCSVAQ